MTPPKILKGPRRKLFAWLVLNGLVQAMLGLAAVFTFEQFHASGFSKGSSVAILAGLAAGLYVSRVLQRRHGEIFALDYVNEMRLALMQKLLSLPDTARGASIGLMTVRLSADLLALKTWLADGLANSIVQGITLLVLLTGSMFLYPGIAAVLVCIILPWSLAAFLLRGPLRESIRDARKQRGKLAALAGDLVVTRLTVAHFGRSTPELNALSRRAETLSSALIRRATYSEAMRATAEWALPIASLMILWLLSAGAGATIPAAPLLLLLGMTSALLGSLSRSIDLQLAHRLASEKFSASLDAASIEQSPAAPASDIGRGEAVEIGLRWTDATGKTTSVTIPPGAVMSLVNGSADERSAALATLARLRDDPRLAITVAGLPATQVSIRDWRRIVTLSSPRLPLVRDTLRNNLAIGAPSKSKDEDIASLARRFGLIADAEELTRPVDPALLSTSRALAMRLCRSLAREASVILLDEATTPSEYPLVEQLLKRARRRNVIVLTSGGVLDDEGVPIGAPIFLPLDSALPGMTKADEKSVLVETQEDITDHMADHME